MNAGPVRHWPLGLSAVSVTALALLPIGFIAQQAVGLGARRTLDLLVRPRVGVLLANTAELVAAGVAASVALGVATAWLVERTDLLAGQVWGALLSVPIAVPAFVRAYGWISVLPSMHGFDGALVIVTLSYYPLVFLPVRAALQSLDPALEEAARCLGVGRWRRFFRVSLPQIRGAVLGGALLVALDLLAEFGAFAMLRFATFATAIYDQYEAAFDGRAAAVLALVLVALCGALLWLEVALRGRTRHDPIGPGARRPVPRHRLRRTRPLAVAGVAGVLLLSLGLPLGSIGYWLSRETAATLDPRALASATATTLVLGFVAAGATLAPAFLVALPAVRWRSRWTVAAERATYLSHALPGIVVALALITVSIRLIPAIYQTSLLLVAGYAILFLPRAVVALRAGLDKAPPAAEEAARVLGTRPLSALWRVIVPLAAPGIGAGAALVFLSVATELTTTLLLAPIGTRTLATEVWAHTNTLTYPAAAPYAALIVAVTIPATLLLGRRVGVYGMARTT